MAYTVKAGDTVSSVAATNGITVDQLVKWNNLIHVGQVLKLDTPVVVPPTPPASTTPKIGGTVKFYDLGPGGTVAANKVVQTALNYEYKGVTIDGDYGLQTSAAYTKWQKSLGYSGADADGVPGKTSITALAKKYSFTVDMAAPPAGAEPAHNYTRTTYDGERVNQRTKDMLNTAAAIYGSALPITQGSYNAGGVAASAGTHDGGGVVDVGLTSASAVLALRKAGFAAWQRTPAEGFAYHIHCVAIGDREMSPSAKDQITSYFNGRNGLANNAKDPVARPWPAWVNKYKG